MCASLLCYFHPCVGGGVLLQFDSCGPTAEQAWNPQITKHITLTTLILNYIRSSLASIGVGYSLIEVGYGLIGRPKCPLMQYTLPRSYWAIAWAGRSYETMHMYATTCLPASLYHWVREQVFVPIAGALTTPCPQEGGFLQ